MADSEKSTIGALLGALGALYTFERLIRLYPPPSGPRVRPGELKGKHASGRAAQAYWAAENAAVRGQCREARTLFARGERYREMSEDRAARGDQTTRDVRGSQRIARAEVKACKAGKNELGAVPVLTPAQSRARVRRLKRKGCRVWYKRVGNAKVVLTDCEEGAA